MEPRRRMQLYRTMHLWHWISAAVCFAALTLFTVTGITLNHASAISAEPAVSNGGAQVPEGLRGPLAAGGVESAEPPSDIAAWAEEAFKLSLRDATAEWSEEELYLSAPGPGRDAWVSIDRASGAAKFEKTDRGWLAYFNDLHKGRNTGITWMIFIDVVAAAVLFFSLTGLVLLWIQARQRTSTWPLVGGGIALVTALMIFFAH
ncbi:MAG TPA: PepSY-associated TM helix domain-containing protein [Steroidobacteraceae bacterium]|nr:PepSY-associated TM helix domain-containing protein [Steroidobacteraceae bacterium]